MAGIKPKELPAKMLRRFCNPNSLGIESTKDRSVMEMPIIAQDRALEAVSFALGMKGLEYNIYVAGPSKADMETLIDILIREAAEKSPPPSDWVYVHSFKDSEHPRAIRFPTGKGREFKKDMEELIEIVQVEIPEIFESEDYSSRKEAVAKEVSRRRAEALSKLEEEAAQQGFVLNVGQAGMMIIPARDGKPMSEEEIKSLDIQEKQVLRSKSEVLQVRMSQVVRELRRLEKELKKKQKELDEQVALYAVGHLIEELEEKYADNFDVLKYLGEVKENIIKNLDDFRQKSGAPQIPFTLQQTQPNLTRYEANVFVDNSECEGAPVVIEANPTFPNLFGTIERKAQFGALFTDFTMLRPGSLHKANGGYLVIKALDLLKNYFSYEGLKRVLKSGEISVEDLGEQLGLFTTRVLKPQPIPLNLKVVLIGSPFIYRLLHFYDEDFPKLFKVKAHLDDQMKATPDEIRDYISFMRTVIEKERLPHLDKTGIARVIEYASELAGHREKLTLNISQVSDIIREASFWVKLEQSEMITAAHVEEAILKKKNRSNLYEERLQELVQENILKVETSGTVVGQVNGLSVLDLGDYMFARPSRITATVSLGKGGVVDIERESNLGGSYHTKGVMILSGYLKNKYAHDIPLALSASIAFEQSYSYIDGDSASSAELFALLSAIANCPAKQSVAITGSVSQRGEIQPIGAVTAKIEGFFDVCNQRGLTGEEGVIIPVHNVKDLMLKREVVEAVREGKFHIYSIATVDEGVEILTGLKAGRLRKDGRYTEGSFNDLVQTSLKEMFKKAKRLGTEKG
jgi:lon-related putative ATP-dependent protease